MLKREIVLPPEHLYPPDEWCVIEAQYSDEFTDRAETVQTLLRDRQPLYEQAADIIIDTSSLSHDQVAQSIRDVLALSD